MAGGHHVRQSGGRTVRRQRRSLHRRLNEAIYRHRDSYVFLGFTTTTKGQATANYNGDPLIYQYPVGFLDASKDLVYSTNQSKIYR
jgi:hypothetical protein